MGMLVLLFDSYKSFAHIDLIYWYLSIGSKIAVKDM